MKKIFYTLSFLLSMSCFANAETCNVNNLNVSGQDCVPTAGFFGQVLTSCLDGEWQTLTFNIPSIQGSGTATVYTAEGESAMRTLPSAQLEATFTTQGAKTITINRPVVNGGRYVWWVEFDAGITRMCYDVTTTNFGASNDYIHAIRVGIAGDAVNSGALRSSGVSSSRMGGAVAFGAVFFVDDTPIPTLSQWGLLLIALLVLNLGLFYVRKKEEVLL